MMVCRMLFLCIALSVRSRFALDVPEAQYLALWDLYNATNGVNWAWLESYSEQGIPWAFGPAANPCNDTWQGVVCSPNTDGNNNVISIYHSDGNMRGQLPESLGDFPQLQRLLLLGSRLSGTIPNTVTNLASLQVLDLSNNGYINGTIPTGIGLCAQLTELNLAYNALTGTLPRSLTNLTRLTTLTVEENFMDGPLPTDLGNMKSLSLLEVYLNKFTGPIPNSVCELTQLTILHLQLNHLSSTIPDCIGNLSQLAYLSLEFNKLSQSIPESIGNLTQLVVLKLNNNYLTHTIPNGVGDLTQLGYVDLFHNRLVGTIPDSVWKLPLLVSLYVNTNHLTGRFVQDFTPSAHHFQHINISGNHLHGTLPESIGLLTDLIVLSSGYNLLSGTIPASISATPLEVLQLNNNAFAGTVPSSLQNLTGLIVLSLKSNRLTGSLSEVFSLAYSNLITVQLDNNQFTGELPSVLFDLPNLISLSIVGSCLHGSLPSNICTATNLEALVLYGLTTGASCRATGVDALSLYRKEFGGALPNCVLTLPKLRTLLLASNRLTGQVSESVRLHESLLQLDLSHNLLTGSIPFSIQNKSWALLDLSHNKLDGVLHSEFFPKLNLSIARLALPEYFDNLNATLPSLAVRSVLSLNTNRLSGPTPNNVKPLRDLSVLAGNLFQCGYDKSDLPQHDSDISNYECASNSFDLSIYLWLGLGVVVPVVAWFLIRYWTHITPNFSIRVPSEFESRVANLRVMLGVCGRLLDVSVCCTAYCMLVLLPYYAVMTQYRGTHTHQYAYVLSAIYTSGALPFALDIALLTALVVLFVVWCRYGPTAYSTEVVTDHVPLSTRGKVFASFVLFNVTAVFGVNVAFVYTVLYQSTAAQTAAQVLLSLFKLGWSTAVSPWMIRQLDNYFIPASEGPAEPFFTLQLLVALFNNIAIPCLVVLAVDPNCFSEVLSPPSSKTVEFLLPVCVENLQKGDVCDEVYYQRSSLSFNPPFTYSYQCSASFITSYAPTFVYMSIATVFINPVLRQGMQRLHARLAPGTLLHKLLSALLPRILQPPPVHPCDKRERPLFRAVGILVTLLMQLGVLLTFGAIFPPVALAMAVSIVATVYTARWELRRFLQTVISSNLLHCLDTINDNCANVGTAEQINRAVSIIVCYCYAFYILFLFDTLGDAKGFRKAAFVLFIVPFAPALLLYVLQYRDLRIMGASNELEERAGDIKLQANVKGVTAEHVENNETMNKLHEV